MKASDVIKDRAQTVRAARYRRIFGRRRPILCPLAFILGVVPLAIATGAGAEMRQSLGTAVFFGMLGCHSVRFAVHAYLLRGCAVALQETAARWPAHRRLKGREVDLRRDGENR